MNDNDLGILIQGLSVLGIIIFSSLFAFGFFQTNSIAEISELKEAQYMQTTYGYEDNMDEYLEYLKVNDFGQYLHLKSVFDDIHSHDNDWQWTIPLVFFDLAGMLGLTIGASFKK